MRFAARVAAKATATCVKALRAAKCRRKQGEEKLGWGGAVIGSGVTASNFDLGEKFVEVRVQKELWCFSKKLNKQKKQTIFSPL